MKVDGHLDVTVLFYFILLYVSTVSTQQMGTAEYRWSKGCGMLYYYIQNDDRRQGEVLRTANHLC